MKKTLFFFLFFLSVITICLAKTKYIPIILITNNKPTQVATQPVRLPDILPPIIEEDIATPSWLIATPTASLTTNIGETK